MFLPQSNGCCMKRGICGVYTIHPPCCLHGSALNTSPFFLTCHHKEVYKEPCNHSGFEVKGNQVSNVRESRETHCRILPKLLKFLTKAQPAEKINIILNSATQNGNTSEYSATDDLLMILALNSNGKIAWKLTTGCSKK